MLRHRGGAFRIPWRRELNRSKPLRRGLGQAPSAELPLCRTAGTCLAFVRLPRSCAGVAHGIQLQYAIATAHPLHRSFLALAVLWPGRERTGGGVGRGTRFIGGNAPHPGTRPGQPGIKGTLKTYYGRASAWHCKAGERKREG